jgi:hypothetical protein
MNRSLVFDLATGCLHRQDEDALFLGRLVLETVPLLIIDDFGMRKLPLTPPKNFWRSS